MKILSSLIFLIVILFSNGMQAITGFAGTLLAMPISIIILGVDEAKVVLNILTIISCLAITMKSYKNINYKEFIKITSIMIIGIIIGIKIFKIISADILIYIYAVLIILIAVKGLFIKKKINLHKYVMFIILVIAGIIHGMFVSGGALLVVYAVNVLKDKDEFRATVAPIWVILNTFMIYDHIKMGYLTQSSLNLILISIIPLFAGVYIGNKIQKKINQETFLNLTYILLIISGILLII